MAGRPAFGKVPDVKRLKRRAKKTGALKTRPEQTWSNEAAPAAFRP